MSGDLASETSAIVILGRVKWFNNKAGYGFITVTDSADCGKDIFVHHSTIKVNNEQYRYLVQGEYVQFSLDHTPGATHAVQAKNVVGINGGLLMCETRRDFKQSRSSYKSDEDNVRESFSKRPRSRAPPTPNPRRRGTGPRSTYS